MPKYVKVLILTSSITLKGTLTDIFDELRTRSGRFYLCKFFSSVEELQNQLKKKSAEIVIIDGNYKEINPISASKSFKSIQKNISVLIACSEVNSISFHPQISGQNDYSIICNPTVDTLEYAFNNISLLSETEKDKNLTTYSNSRALAAVNRLELLSKQLIALTG